MTSNSTWTDIRQLLRTVAQIPIEWNYQDFDLFFEVEFGLYVYELIVPASEERICTKASILFSGYFIETIHTTEESKRISLRARQILQYVRSSTGWTNWLEWYSRQPQTLRLYDVDLKTGIFKRRQVNLVLKDERFEFYLGLLEEDKTVAQSKPRWAKAGLFTVDIAEDIYEVNIPEELAAIAHTPTPRYAVEPRTREAIKVRFDELKEAANKLEEKDPEGNWRTRFANLRMQFISNGYLCDKEEFFYIKDLFHLIGTVGSGKSTLIQLLTYHLASKQNLHITIISNTIVEAANLADWFCRVGIKSAPALGTNRAAHRIKYGQANFDKLNPEEIYRPNANNVPALNWFTGSCAISGMINEPIPVDQLPCYHLKGSDGESYICPVIPACSIHRVERDLIDSQVWIVNPYSFLFSRAPYGLSPNGMRLFEAIYHRSDLLIVDEADRVQVQWDRSFAPINDLAGSDNALLDVLHARLATQSVGRRGRQKTKRTHYLRLKDLDHQANMLSDHILRLLYQNPDLVNWTKRRQLTNPDLYERLSNELAKLNFDPKQRVNDDIKDRLQKEFNIYWRDPLTREKGVLSEWVTDVVISSADMRPTVSLKKIRDWLQSIVSWNIGSSSHKTTVLRHLQFALLLTALVKRTNDILHQLPWVEAEVGDIGVENFQLPEAIFDLIPDAPLGNLLGLRYFENEMDQGGSLKYLQYSGIGRWLLMNFNRLYEHLSNGDGPHVLLTSATSWAPQSSDYHISKSPDAVLLPPDDNVAEIVVEFRPIPSTEGFIRVSGTQIHRYNNLKRIVRHLAQSSAFTTSALDVELQYWQEQGFEERRVLLVVGSYEEANLVWQTLEGIREWEGRSVRLLPDDAEVKGEGSIYAREVEKLHQYKADVLIAPLMAIQRGFNILDALDGALLGSVFFLVRPYPTPDDITQHIISLNSWAMTQMKNGRYLESKYVEKGIGALSHYRRLAYAEWHDRLSSGRYGMDSITPQLYPEFLWNQFVVVWQTIGRLIRGGRPAHVFFVDEAFHPSDRKRKMLRDWLQMMETEMNSSDHLHRDLMALLYGPAYTALKKLEQSLGYKEDVE